MKKAIQILVASMLLALWAAISFIITGSMYALIGSRFHSTDFWDLERTIGGFTLHITSNVSVDILWLRVLVCSPIFILLAIPAAWVVTRRRKT